MSPADHLVLWFWAAVIAGMFLAVPAAGLLDAARRLLAALPRRRSALLAPWSDRAPGEGFEKGSQK